MALEVVGSTPITHPTFFFQVYFCHIRVNSRLFGILGCRQVGKAPDSGSGISRVRVLPSQPNFHLCFGICWDIAKSVRHQTLTLAFRRFESCQPSQVLWRRGILRRLQQTQFHRYWGVAKLVRHQILVLAFRGFESYHPSHMGH